MAFPVSSTPRRVVFTGKQQVELQPFEFKQPEENQVLVRVEKTLMSTGTENIVFNRLFAEGSHWDRWVKYPFYPGYCAVGTVEVLGLAAKSLAVGDRVALRCGHQSHAVWRETDCYALPADLPFEQAVWFALAKIAFHGAKAADYKLGDDVVIIGAGPIGQMSTRWARASGVAGIIVVDAIEKRLDLARKGGATAVVSLPIAEAKDAILAANGGVLPRVVIDSTGHPAVFAAALGLAKNFGTVVVLGDTGTPAGQHLTSDVVLRGIHIVGVHDGHNTPEWNQATITKLFLALASSGRFALEGLDTHHFAPEECAEAYGVANRDRASTMGILFNWS